MKRAWAAIDIGTNSVRLLLRRQAGQAWEEEKRVCITPVSYTHLDVYKRQGRGSAGTDGHRYVLYQRSRSDGGNGDAGTVGDGDAEPDGNHQEDHVAQEDDQENLCA